MKSQLKFTAYMKYYYLEISQQIAFHGTFSESSKSTLIKQNWVKSYAMINT